MHFAEFQLFQPEVGNTHGTRVERVASSFYEILRGIARLIQHSKKLTPELDTCLGYEDKTLGVRNLIILTHNSPKYSE